jgi:hypothetical protein
VAAQVKVASMMPSEYRARVLGHPLGYYDEDMVRGERGFAEQALSDLAGHKRAMLHLDLDPTRIEYQVDPFRLHNGRRHRRRRAAR